MAVLYKKQTPTYVFFKMLFLCISGFFTSSIIFIFCLPTFLLFWCISKFAYFLIWVKLGDTFTRPTGMDILQGLESEKSRPFINMVARCEGKVDFEIFAKKFHEEIMMLKNKRGELRYKKFGQVFEQHYGYHIFRDAENFDIRNRIEIVDIKTLFPEKNFNNSDSEDVRVKKISSIEKPVDQVYVKYETVVNEEKKERYMLVDWEILMERALDKYGSRKIAEGVPQWEILLIEEENCHNIIFRMHHSYCDGIYFLRFLMEHFSDTPLECKLPYNYHQPNVLKRWLVYVWAFCMLPYGFFRLSFSYDKSPLHGPKLSGKKMFLMSKPIDLDIIKEVKQETNTSINSVLFACMSYALTSHFRKKKALLDKVFAVVPVSFQDLNRPIKLKNRFGLIGVLLPTFMNKKQPLGDLFPPSCIERLQEVHDFLTYCVRDPSFIAIHWMMIFFSYLLPTRLLNIVFSTKGLTSTMSNVVGPQEEILYFTGRPTKEFAFWVPDRTPMGMGVSISGYKGKIRIGLMADKNLMQNNVEGYEFLENYIQEIINLREECRAKSKMMENDLNFRHSKTKEDEKNALKNIP